MKHTPIKQAFLITWCIASASCALDSGDGSNPNRNRPCPTFNGGSYVLTVLSSDDGCDLGFANQSGRVVDINGSGECIGELNQDGCHVELLNSECDEGTIQSIVLDFKPDTGSFEGTFEFTVVTGEFVCVSTHDVRLTPVE